MTRIPNVPSTGTALHRSNPIGRLIGLVLAFAMCVLQFIAVGTVQAAEAADGSGAATGTSFNKTVSLKTTEVNGFVHPGLTVSPADLERTRGHLIAGDAPWTTYFDAMAKTDYAKLDKFAPANLKEGTFDQPANPAFADVTMQNKLSKDGFTAYTYGLMYYFTGDVQYRAHALQLVRTWENMDPAQYKTYTDAHIHMPVPFYYMVSAAELLQYTSVPEGQTTVSVTANGVKGDVNLAWTDEDTTKLTKNLIDPSVATFLSKNNTYFNQHILVVIGNLASSIYKNDAEAYARTVEWATVNKTDDKPNSNGAIATLFAKMSADDPRNNTGQDFIQHLEMGRDAAHAGNDPILYTAIARILDQQNTKVDPVTGEISTAANAQTLYEFRDNLLLKGAEQFYAYTYGYTIPWVQLKEDGGSKYPALVSDGVTSLIDYGGAVAKTFRGRITRVLGDSELYDLYKYKFGMSDEELQKIAPTISFASNHLHAPVYYDGTAKKNFWGAFSDSKMTELGCEYWMSIPDDRKAADNVPADDEKEPSMLFADRAALLDTTRAKAGKDSNGTTYVRVQAAKNRDEIKETAYDSRYPKDTKTVRGGSQIAMSNIARVDGNKQIVWLNVRTNGPATIYISGGNDGGNYANPYMKLSVPDTKGVWTGIAYNRKATPITADALPAMEQDYYAVVSDNTNTTVDFNKFAYAGGSSPTIGEPTGTTYSLVKGQSFTHKLDVTGTNGSTTYNLVGAPNGMTIAKDGTITWTPGETTSKPQSVIARVVQDYLVYPVELNFNVYGTRQQAIDAVSGQVDGKVTYTTESRDKVAEAKTAAEKLVESGADDAFDNAMIDLTNAVNGLKELNPKLADGTLDYSGMVSATAQKSSESVNVAGLVDADTETYDGNLFSKYITFDFGMNYRVNADAFGFEARTGFPNRLQGANVYGSVDGRNWTLLTESETKFDNNMQKIAVKSDLRGEQYRYLRIQNDSYGADTDPAWPGIVTRGEFRIFGERHETVNFIKSVSLAGSGLKNRVVKGDKATLSFTGKEKLTDVVVKINGQDVKAQNVSGDDWKAEYVVRDSDSGPVAFSIDYKNAKGEQATTILDTTDGSSLYVSDETGLVKDLESKAIETSNGKPTADLHTWFDGDAKTFKFYSKESPDSAPRGGQTYVTFDLGDNPIALDHVEYMMPHEDGKTHENLAKIYYVQGSNDNSTSRDGWTTLVSPGSSTSDWQSLASSDTKTKYRYIRVYCWANYLGFAEFRMFATTDKGSGDNGNNNGGDNGNGNNGGSDNGNNGGSDNNGNNGNNGNGSDNNGNGNGGSDNGGNTGGSDNGGNAGNGSNNGGSGDVNQNGSGNQSGKPSANGSATNGNGNTNGVKLSRTGVSVAVVAALAVIAAGVGTVLTLRRRAK